jgi:hypothetical protein
MIFLTTNALLRKEFQRGLTIPALGDIAFQHFSFMVNGSPQVVRLSVNSYEHFVQMPLPVRICTKLLNPFSSDLRGEQRAKSVPPEPHRFMADIDPAFVQQILHIPE